MVGWRWAREYAMDIMILVVSISFSRVKAFEAKVELFTDAYTAYVRQYCTPIG
jgi:hypothetical protein